MASSEWKKTACMLCFTNCGLQVQTGGSDGLFCGEIHTESELDIALANALGIVKAGCVVVSIADSFAPDEIGKRLDLSHAKGIFTQDFIVRGGKSLPLYEKAVAANCPAAGNSTSVPSVPRDSRSPPRPR